jgi:two-component system, NtrC family, sensor histidine kinase GlrK
MTIFARLMLGYLLLLIMATGVGMYSILQLGKVSEITHSILLVDNSLTDLHKNLTDALLSATRNEKKFVILRDQALYTAFLAAKNDFEKYLQEAVVLADSAAVQDILSRVRDLHQDYQALFEAEVASLQTGKFLPEAQHRREKERLVNEVMEELARLKVLNQQSILQKVQSLDEAGNKARTMAGVITGLALLFGIVLSLSITASITIPLARMKKKTGEIAAGLFKADLNLPSPPEVGALAQALNTMCAKLQEVDRMKSDFYSLMSHEMRTPLTSIKEGTNLFLEGLGGEVTEKQRELLTIIAEESNRLIGLVNPLLDLAKLEAGMVTFHFAEADLSPLVAQAVREVAPLAEAKNISIENDLGEVPPLSLDAERMLQVLRNLLGNALKFTPHGGSIRVSLCRGDAGITVAVRDTGPGIPQEHSRVIFEKFNQVSPDSSRKFQGTGLGLSIVQHIVHAHGGRVWVESEVGRGSTFFFVLSA